MIRPSLSKRDIELLVEALRMAGSRHESMGHATKRRARSEHFDKNERMQILATKLLGAADDAIST